MLVTMENVCFSAVVVVCRGLMRTGGKLIDIVGVRAVLNGENSFV